MQIAMRLLDIIENKMEINRKSTYEDYYKFYNNSDKEVIKNVETFKVATDLISKWYRKKLGSGNTPEENRNKKMLNCYNGEDVNGLGLELAFGLGTSTHWLINRYDNIILDGIDFQKHLNSVAVFLKELSGEKK